MRVRPIVIGLVAITAAVFAAGATAFAVEEFPPPPDGVVGTPYSFVFKPKDGAPPFAFSFKAGDLPPGLKIESDGTFHGTPTTPGTFNFDVNATQYCGCDSQRSFTVKIRDRLTVTTTSLKSAAIGAPYAASLSVTGNGGLGLGWKITAGSLPAGLTLAADGSPADGLISGTPTAVGTSTFTVTVGDTDGFVPNRAVSKQFTLAVVAPLALVAQPTPLPTGVVGKPFTAAPVTATGGLGPYTWTVTGGTPPPGIDIAPATGALAGKPTAAGAYSFMLGVTDAEGRTATTAVDVTVAPALGLVTKRVRNAKVRRPYKIKLSAKGGLLPRTWKVTRGKLPAGLRLNSKTGVVSGKPKKAGSYRFTVTVSDPFPEKSSRTIVLKVRA